MSDERKPRMSEARRKVLNLLEFILEIDPATPSVDSLFYKLSRVDNHFWTDEDMAVILEGYANDLLRENEYKCGS